MTSLKQFIHAILLEADDASKTDSSSLSKSDVNSKEPKAKGKSKIKPPVFEDAEEFSFNSWQDICYTTHERNHWYSLYKNLFDFLNESQEGSPSGPGYVLFGVQRYSPVGDILGSTVVDLFKSQIQKYQAYGHAWVMFVDENGLSERYEFAFDQKGACDPLTKETVIKNIDDILKRDQKYAASLYDNLASAIGAGFGALIGGVLGAASTFGTFSATGAALGGVAGSAVGKLTQMTVDDATKSYILREIMPTIVTKYPKKLGELIHFNLPGSVYDAAGQPQTKMLTAKKFVEIATKVDPMTNAMIINITDFAESDDISGAEMLWDQQMEKLRRILGA